MFITVVPITKLVAWGEGDSGGHVLRETMSPGLYGLDCPSRTSEGRGKRDCVKEEARGRRRGAQEGACTGAATTSQLLMLRFRSGIERSLGFPVGLYKKKMQKFAVHTGGDAENGGAAKRNVLSVIVLFPIAIDLAMRSNTQRRVYVLRT